VKGRVPGSVQWALHAAGELPHPYYNLNAKLYSWVDEKVWYYRTTFNASPRKGYAILCFDGIDYFSRVWLNGAELGQHEGMFGGPVIEVGRLLKRDEPNSLVVEVRAANWGVKKGWNHWKLGRIIKPWVLAGGLGAETFFPLGIWRPVRLEYVPPVHLERPRLTTRYVTAGSALLDLEAEILADTHSLEAELHPWRNKILSAFRDTSTQHPLNIPYSLTLEMKPKGSEASIPLRQTVPLRLYQGRNWAQMTVPIAKPRLWWPNGLGRPDLYHVRISLTLGAATVDQIEFDYGIRNFETSPTAGPRTQDRWSNWQFSINGRKFFAKGMNWMPADILLDLPTERYRWLLETARSAGIQLIRVWGGGLIETDEFYKLADELGILVWQDFPIGNQDTPLWPQEVWEAQVVQNVFRLRNHPSLAIWCGGNEFNAYSLGNAASIGIIERSVRDFDGPRPLLRTSPDGGSIHTYPDMDPTWYAQMYAQVPFIAETGMHSIPAASIREVVASEELKGTLGNLYSKEFASAHPDFVHHFVEFQASRVPRMLSRASQIDDMSSPTLEALSEASQIGAGEFYQVLSDGMQGNYPVTAGLLPWVFKRPWPTVGVMLVDGFGQPSAPYYFLKRTYERVHVALALPHLLWSRGEQVPMSLRIMNANAVAGGTFVASVEIFDPQLRSCWRQSAKVHPAPAPSVTRQNLGSFLIPSTFEEKFFFAVVELRDSANTLISRSVYWPRCLRRMADTTFREKYRSAPQPVPSFDKGPWLKPQTAGVRTRLAATLLSANEQTDRNNHLLLRIRNIGARPAFMTEVDIEGRKRVFRASDNFFWLAPGEQRDIDLDILWRDSVQAGASCTVRAWNADRLVLKLPK